MKKFIEDFKKFAMKGNVIDMAVGVVIGGAFGKIVTSLVNDIITPLISMVTGRTNLAELSVPLSGEKGTEGYVGIMYGQFVQNIIDFLIIALNIFIVIRIIGKFNRKQEAKKAEEMKKRKKPHQKSRSFLLKSETS